MCTITLLSQYFMQNNIAFCHAYMTVGCIVAIVLTVVAVMVSVAVVYIYRATRFKMQRTQGIEQCH